MKTTVTLFGCFLLIQTPVFAKCPVTDGSTLTLRASVGNLLVDTSGTGFVDVQVSGRQVEVKEICGKETVEITGTASATLQEKVEWKIAVPRGVHLDLVTLGGSINVGNTDGNATLRTTGGDVVAGQIKGRAAIITQAGSIKAGNIGGDAELRSRGGSLEVGNIGGSAELEAVSTIVAGIVSGTLKAVTAGGNITIKESTGAAVAETKAGDISIGNAGPMNAKTAGGNITSIRVRGLFQGHTDSGNIRIESAAAPVEASTGYGDIVVRLVPDNQVAGLHVDLQSGIGDVTLYLSERMKATIDATVEKPAFESPGIFSDFPMNSLAPGRIQGLAPGPGKFYSPPRSQTLLNGGGSPIKLHTSLGKIQIRKQ